MRLKSQRIFADKNQHFPTLVQARCQNSVTGGAEINFGGEREVYFVWIQKGHGGTRNLSLSGSKEQGVVRKFKGIFRLKSEIQVAQVTSKKKGLHWNFKEFSGRNQKFKWFFRLKTSDLQKKKVFTEISRDFLAEIEVSSGFSNFKSIKNTNLGLDLRSKAPNLLISSGHSPRLGEHNFRLGGHKQSVEGARPRYAPPWRRVCAGFVFE